jgi:O-antigen ligase
MTRGEASYGRALGLAFVATLSVLVGLAVVTSAASGVILLAVAGASLAAATVVLTSGAVLDRTVEAVSEKSFGRRLAFVGLFLSCAPALAVTSRMSVSELIFLVALFFALVEALTTSRRVHVSTPLVVFIAGAAMLAVGGILASGGYHGPGGSAKAALHSAYQVALPAVVFALVCRSARDVSTAIKVWVASIAVSSVVGALELSFSGAFPAAALNHGRAVGLTLHPNDLGSIAGMATAAAWVLVANSRGAARAGWIAAALSLLGGILVSGSAGGMIAGVIALAVWMLLDRSRGKATVVLAAALIAFAAIALVAPFATSSAERLHGIITGTTPTEANTALIRIHDYRFGIKTVVADPIVGVGADSRAAISPQGTRVQNVLLQPWMELGLLGFFGAVFLMSASAASIISTLRSSRGSPLETSAVALTTVFVAFVFVASEQLVFTKMIWWIPIGLIFGAGAALANGHPAD